VYGGRFSPRYPWEGVVQWFATSSVAVVFNFEGCVSERLYYDAAYPFRFAVSPRMLSGMPAWGMAYASLANNHAFDCGREAISETRTYLESATATSFGIPYGVSTSSVAFVEVDSRRVAIVGVHTLYGTPDVGEVTQLITHAAAQSDLQVVYVHWGDEYELQANKAQYDLAQQWARAGADIIIGHHPHVVQEIEVVEGALVFYSLGNFIFDQFFSNEVQDGLVVRLTMGTVPHLHLEPVTSRETRSQPWPMTNDARKEFLQSLAKRSDPQLASAIMAGQIPLGEYLASSTNFSIITP